MSTDAANVLNMSDRRRGSGPQVEDGYVRIANELFEAILLKLNSYRNIKIVLAIVRKTYGYNKKEDDITISQIAEITGIHRNHVGVALRNLEQMRVIKPVHAGQHGLIIGINKHHQEWLTAPAKPRGASTNSVDAEINQNSCAEQPNQLLETTKLVDGGNQNVAHNRQTQKTTPKDNPKKIAQSDDCAASAAAAFEQFWQTFGYKKGKAKAEEAFAREYAKAKGSPDWLQTVMQAAAKEAQRRLHLIAAGQTPIYAQGWLTQRRYEDEDLQSWGAFTADQQAFIDTFNANIGDTCPPVTEWTEKRAALCEIAAQGKWSLETWGEFWRYVRDDCVFSWPVSFEWMLDRENLAKVKGGQYLRDEEQA